jgi:aspartyl-tRNA(Asn)/glutamyl-tRNA(Gln) amidotransferase subunit A
VDVAGIPTLAGSRIRPNQAATADATVVARLRDAGAIILGKTVTTEFASFDPPPTRNPWKLDRTPGGSSSGSAAAVALGMCLGAIGSQTGGSITRPASFCGVAGCKPSYGRVSLAGIVPLAVHMDHPGPIASCVTDLAILLGAIAGEDAADPLSSSLPVDNYVAAIAARTEAPRLMLLEGGFWSDAEPAVQSSLRSSIHTLRNHFITVDQSNFAVDMPDVVARHRRIMTVEAAEFHRPWFPAQRAEYGKHLAALLDEGRQVSALDYAAALRRQAEFRQQALAALGDADALVVPATVTTAPTAETTGNPRFNSPWSYCGLPTVSFPCTVADDGLPLSLQLVGRPFGEAALLSVAAWCEKAIQFAATPSMLHA